jgi:HTH-type transcriptional regulator, competence development regulator
MCHESVTPTLNFMTQPISSPGNRGELGQYLWDLRKATKMSLRDVEDAAEVSNAYVSQLENGKITKPSPDILHRLAEAYEARLPPKGPVLCSFEKMMQLAGHLIPAKAAKRRGRLPTFVSEELSAEEEDELLKYLAFIRMRKGTRDNEK